MSITEILTELHEEGRIQNLAERLQQEKESYIDAGIQDPAVMQTLDEADINGEDAKKLSGWGFQPEEMKILQERFCIYLHDPHNPSPIEQYVKAGFDGDLASIVALSDRDEWGYSNVDAHHALFLGEHGLKGDANAMLSIPRGIGDDRLEGIAQRIANQLDGEKITPGNLRVEYKQSEEIRKKYATDIPVDDLVILVQYNWGESDIAETHQTRVEYRRVFATDNNGKLTKETVEARERCHEAREEIMAAQDRRLLKVFQELKECGVEAFKATYSPHPGWVDNNASGLRYDHSQS